MQALSSDRVRRFAYIMGRGELSAAEAARQAGYSDHLGADKVRAHHLMHNEDVLAAIEEVARKQLLGAGPLAVNAAILVLKNPKHPQHARMIETVLDRVGFSTKTEHTVNVRHEVDFRELESLARRLALQSGVPVERLLGGAVLQRGDSARVIEHVRRVRIRPGGEDVRFRWRRSGAKGGE